MQVLIGQLPGYVQDWAIFFATVTSVLVVLSALQKFWLSRYKKQSQERLFTRQVVMLLLSFIGLAIVIMSLPAEKDLRVQALQLIGLLLSGLIALSSSTVISNMIAGFMLRITKPFVTGDFVTVGDFRGRVVSRGLFDTVIQTEARGLLVYTNGYLISQPLQVVKPKNVLVSTTFTLGYDVHHNKAEKLLVRAAGKAGLENSFMLVKSLEDHAVTYQVSGVLPDASSMLSAQSRLARCILDALHDARVEIMSPVIMDQRRVKEDVRMMPSHNAAKSVEESADAVVFDKVEKAMGIEEKKESVTQWLEDLKAMAKKARGENKDKLSQAIKQAEKTLAGLHEEQIEDE